MATILNCHVGHAIGFKHLVIFSQIHSKAIPLDSGFIVNSAILDSAILLKNFPSHSDLTLLAAINSVILDSAIFKKNSLVHSDSTWWWQQILQFRHCQFKHLVIFSQIHSFILTQFDDGNHPEFCHVGFSHLGFTANLDSDILLSFLRFTQKQSWTLTPFLTLIHSKALSLHSDSI